MRFPRILRAVLVLALGPLCHGQAPAASAPAPARPTATPPARENFHVYLLMGQSNMAGRGALDANPPTDEPRILALAPDGSWVVARDPLHRKIGGVEPGAGPGLSFARKMLESDPKITIGLVPCAVGGSPLRRWVKGGDLYEEALARARAASQAGLIRGVLWHQGETDAAKPDTAATYEKRLTGMIADLRQDLRQPDLPFVVGQLGDFLKPEKQPDAETVRAALRRIPTLVRHTGYVDSAGLVHKGDSLHFNTASARELGARFAVAMQALETP